MYSFPIYKPHDKMDCGPTSARMMAKHYGKTENMEMLRQAPQINKEVVSLSGIAERKIKGYLKNQLASIRRMNVIQKPNIHLRMSFLEVAISSYTKSLVAISGSWSFTSSCIDVLIYPTSSSASFSPNFCLRERKSCISLIFNIDAINQNYAFQTKK
jgi:hypothetical protein